MKKLMIIIPLLLFAAMQLPFIRWIPDDAYISFQYAKHFSRGEGLVFNLGERVEGFSNFLWTLYLGAIGRLGFDIVHASVLTSSLAAFAALLLIIVLLLRIQPIHSRSLQMRRITLAAACMSASFFPLAFYATSGMESSAYLLFVILGITLQIHGMMRKMPLFLFLACLPLLAAALIRPEGILFLGGSVFYSIVTTRPLPRRLPAALLLPLALYFGILLLKALYFGGLIPNTYYAKPGFSLNYLTPALEGSFYLLRFAIKSALILLVPFTLFPPSEQRRVRVWAFLWFILCLQLFFIVYVGVDVLRFDRFVIPIYPCYLALAILGISELISVSGQPARRFTVRFVYVCVGLIIASNFSQAVLARHKRCIHDWMHGNSLATLGLVIRETFPEARTVIANEVGAVTYYSDMTVIDILGLTDRTISGIRYRSYLEHGTGSSKESIDRIRDYILSRDPDIVILPTFTPIANSLAELDPDSMHPLWYGILARPWFERDFLKIISITVNENKYLTVMARRGTQVVLPDPAHWPENGCSRIQWHAASPGDTLHEGAG